MAASNVGVDLDSVIANLSKLASKIWNEQHPDKQFNLDYWDEWNLYKKLGISKSQFHDLLDSAWLRFHEMEFEEPNVTKSLQKLMKAGHVVTIITNRNKHTHSYVMEWLSGWDVPYDVLILNANGPQKGDYSLDYLIDDNPGEVTRYYSGTSNNGVLLLRDQPWNSGLVTVPSLSDMKVNGGHVLLAKVIRVSSLAIAVEYIIEKEKE